MGEKRKYLVEWSEEQLAAMRVLDPSIAVWPSAESVRPAFDANQKKKRKRRQDEIQKMMPLVEKIFYEKYPHERRSR